MDAVAVVVAVADDHCSIIYTEIAAALLLQMMMMLMMRKTDMNPVITCWPPLRRSLLSPCEQYKNNIIINVNINININIK